MFGGSVWFPSHHRALTYMKCESNIHENEHTKKQGKRGKIGKKRRSKRFCNGTKRKSWNTTKWNGRNFLSIHFQNVSTTQKPQKRQQNDYDVLFCHSAFSSFVLIFITNAHFTFLPSKHFCFFLFNHQEKCVYFCDAFNNFLCWLNSSCDFLCNLRRV